MTFDDIPSGAAIFLDTNCLVYAVSADPRYGPACKRLLERIDNQDIQGFISAHVLGEMAHRVMTLEAATRFNRPLTTGLANWLRRHPSEVQQLTRHRQAIDEVRAAKVQLFPIEGADVSRAADLSIPFGLLSSDALIVVIMQRYSLSHLARAHWRFVQRAAGFIPAVIVRRGLTPPLAHSLYQPRMRSSLDPDFDRVPGLTRYAPV